MLVPDAMLGLSDVMEGGLGSIHDISPSDNCCEGSGPRGGAGGDAQGQQAGATGGGRALLVVGEEAQSSAGVRRRHEEGAAADEELRRPHVHRIKVLRQLAQLVVLHRPSTLVTMLACNGGRGIPCAVQPMTISDADTHRVVDSWELSRAVVLRL